MKHTITIEVSYPETMLVCTPISSDEVSVGMTPPSTPSETRFLELMKELKSIEECTVTWESQEEESDVRLREEVKLQNEAVRKKMFGGSE